MPESMPHEVICRETAKLTPQMRVKLAVFLGMCKDHGIPIFVTETYRSPERQGWLFANKKSKAQPGHSAHEYGEAFDIAFRPEGDLNGATWDAPQETWLTIRAIAEFCELVWGGNWTHEDKPHFQNWGWHSPVV